MLFKTRFLLHYQGTTILPLPVSVLFDESEWESPYSFNPSHFLDKEGKFCKRDAFFAFSAGTLLYLNIRI